MCKRRIQTVTGEMPKYIYIYKTTEAKIVDGGIAEILTSAEMGGIRSAAKRAIEIVKIFKTGGA